MMRDRIVVFASQVSRKNVLIAVVLLVLISALVVWMYLRNASATKAASASTSKASIEIATVEVALPERHEITRQVSMPASIEAFEQTTLYAKTSGYLKWIKVDIGDRVHKGETVAEIDVPE